MATDSRYVLASKLAQFLRRNGDKVIEGSSKLSLTTSALCLLNSLFVENLHPDFQNRIEFSDSAVYGINEDIQYLYDFMKRTTSLKLFHGTQTLRGGVDLSHFSNLTVLELRKIPAHLLVGLNSTSSQLKAFICSRSISLLKEIFNSGEDEENSSYAWCELKELNLSYNYLESLDSSIGRLQNLEILNLSHNNIQDTDEIKLLKGLKFVNLSYNQLETLPCFNSLCCRFLNKLYVRNNNLEKLEGLECLFNLEEFDVGYNLLTEYSALSPLDKLKSLKVLNLEGNPIYFHKQYLKLVVSFLHPYALNRGIKVNGKLILIPQITNVVVADTVDSSRHQTSINTLVGDIQSVRPSEVQDHFVKKRSPLASIDSASSYTSQSDFEQMNEKGISKNKKGKKPKIKKVREALICDPDEVDIDNSTVKDEGVPSHIKTKQEFEARREERGESWLIADNPFQTYSPKVPTNTPVVNGIAPESLPVNLSQKLAKCLESESFDTSVKPPDTSTPKNEMKDVLSIPHETIPDLELERKRHISKESDIEILASNLQGPVDDVKVEVQSHENLSDCDDFYDSCNLSSSGNGASDEFINAESEEESEDSIFFVENVTSTSQQMISVNIGPKFAAERDVMTAKVLDKLDLSCLSSVDMVIKEKDDSKVFEINLVFHTAKRSRQKRCYVFQDLDSAQRMSKLLEPFADANTLKEATIGALECLKCKSQFSKLVADRKVIKKKLSMGKEVLSSSYDSSKEHPEEAYACPNCGNLILIEIETMPLPSVAAPPCLQENKINVPQKSPQTTPDTVSVGSASSGNLFASLFSSIKLSPITKRKSISAPLNDSLGGDSFKSGDTLGANECDKKTTEYNIRRNSSDITIISNPSQSSIAVIPDPSLENNLNTILERDSLASLSPVSGSSTASAPLEKKSLVNVKETPAITNDQDFFSFESVEEGQEQAFKTSDIASNDSDVYLSPCKAGKPKGVDAESTDIMLILGEKRHISYDFTELDHRLKLHVEINIFGNEEHMIACLETSIVPLNTGEEFAGMFVLSSKNIYIIKFKVLYSYALQQNEFLGAQVQVLYSGSSSQIKQIKSLMGNQGISIACGSATHIYTLFIKDADTCNSFFNVISEQLIERNPQLQIVRDTAETLKILYESVLLPNVETSDSPQILLHQFASQEDKDVKYPVCVILTPEEIILSKILYKKQHSCSDLTALHPYCYTDVDHQKLSDVVSLKLTKDLMSVEMHFLIESAEVESMSWMLTMKTKSALFSFINALKNPWEELFGVSLPLSMVESS